MGILSLFGLGARGVNIVTAKTHLTPEEMTSAQNAEFVSDQGEEAIEQRPGMTRLNASAMSGSVLMAQDVPAELLVNKTPTLYAGMYSTAAHTWRKSTDGTTWTDADSPAKPFSANANIAAFWKNFPKFCSIGKKGYFVDGLTPIQLHSWDGTTDAVLSTIPPSVSGVNLATPTAAVADYNSGAGGATTYTYKLVARQGASYSAASAAVSVTTGAASLTAGHAVELRGSAVVAGATYFDVYRTAGGGSTGKIGTIAITSGAFTYGNGSQIATYAPTGVTVTNIGTAGATAYSYVVIAKSGSNTSDPSPTGTTATGNTALSAINYNLINASGTVASTYDVYRTVGGATQGKIISNSSSSTGWNDTGLVGDGTTPPVTFSGTATDISPYVFVDAGLTGDATVAPVAASGATAGDALGVLDMITDGTSLYLAVLDQAAADPTVVGRVLQYSPGSNTWTQIGLTFPLSAGNGGPSALISYDGSFVYGTHIGITAGNTSYLKTLANPLPAGGFPETHTTAVSQATVSLAVFNGDLYAGYVSLVAGTAAIVAKRTPIATWSTSLTAVATAQYNGYTALGVFNGSLFAGWTSGGGATAANIKSTVDGITWTAEIALDVAEVPCQMVTFRGALYVVVGRTGAAYNTKSRILKRDTSGTWTAVDDPSDDFAGCLGVVYV